METWHSLVIYLKVTLDFPSAKRNYGISQILKKKAEIDLKGEKMIYIGQVFHNRSREKIVSAGRELGD